jgi:hypothetical protein
MTDENTKTASELQIKIAKEQIQYFENMIETLLGKKSPALRSVSRFPLGKCLRLPPHNNKPLTQNTIPQKKPQSGLFTYNKLKFLFTQIHFSSGIQFVELVVF